MAEPPKRKVRIQYEEIAKALKGKPEPSKVDLLDWVFNHIGLDASKLPYEEFPCVGAAWLLVEANKNRKAFLALWSKTIPTQTQLKLGERPKDDRRILGLLEALENPDAEVPEATDSEPPVPPEDSGTGEHQPDGAG